MVDSSVGLAKKNRENRDYSQVATVLMRLIRSFEHQRVIHPCDGLSSYHPDSIGVHQMRLPDWLPKDHVEWLGSTILQSVSELGNLWKLTPQGLIIIYHTSSVKQCIHVHKLPTKKVCHHSYKYIRHVYQAACTPNPIVFDVITQYI